MMAFESVGTSLIDDVHLPWVPFTPNAGDVCIKLVKADPVRGETISFLKAPVGASLPRHHHTGTVIVYTIKGAWRYREHNWLATPGSIVFETAASSHTPIGIEGYGDEIITLNITVGDLIYLDEKGQLIAMENWRTMLDRYLTWCNDNGLEPCDVTSFAGQGHSLSPKMA